MKARRHFLKLASAAAAVPGAAIAQTDYRADGDGKVVGTWQSTHTLPFPPDSFRELLSFADGGILHETNSFLHTASNLDFSSFGLPNLVNASDGQGNWVRSKRGLIQVVFRKILFDGSRRNFGDLYVSGVVLADENRIRARWQVRVVDLEGAVILDFGSATSEGVRLS
jgi:hypothetical protein